MTASHHRNDGQGRANGRRAGAVVNAPGDPTPDEIIAAIQGCVSQAHEPSIDSLATDAELADELTRRVRQLARKGPRHALIAAFSSASEMLTLAMVRVQAQFLRDLGTFDRAKIGVSDAGRLGLPPDAMEAVSIVSSLSSQLTDLASAYGKFVHVTNIGKKSDEPVFNHGTGTPRPVGPDRNGHAGRENGTGEARQRRF